MKCKNGSANSWNFVIKKACIVNSGICISEVKTTSITFSSVISEQGVGDQRFAKLGNPCVSSQCSIVICNRYIIQLQGISYTVVPVCPKSGTLVSVIISEYRIPDVGVCDLDIQTPAPPAIIQRITGIRSKCVKSCPAAFEVKTIHH